MAHATNPDAVKNAIRLGAHSVEHGYIMDDAKIGANRHLISVESGR
jgi:imidazolonepropionase-like amidohydrolase